jgi:hypothetical protein
VRSCYLVDMHHENNFIFNVKETRGFDVGLEEGGRERKQNQKRKQRMNLVFFSLLNFTLTIEFCRNTNLQI